MEVLYVFEYDHCFSLYFFQICYILCSLITSLLPREDTSFQFVFIFFLFTHIFPPTTILENLEIMSRDCSIPLSEKRSPLADKVLTEYTDVDNRQECMEKLIGELKSWKIFNFR